MPMCCLIVGRLAGSLRSEILTKTATSTLSASVMRARSFKMLTTAVNPMTASLWTKSALR